MRIISLLSMIAAAALWFVQPPAYAADPPQGTISPSQDVTWRGGPFTVSNPVPFCAGSGDPTCDHFALTVDADGGTHVMIAIASDVDGDDYDLYVYFPDGSEAAHNATGGDDLVVFDHRTDRGAGPYEVRVAPAIVTPGSTYQGAATMSSDPVDNGLDCDTYSEIPDTTCTGVTDFGQVVFLDAVILLDGVNQARGEVVMANAAESYAPLRISLRATFRDVAFTGNDAQGLIDQAKVFFGGERPPGSDVVYVLTAKDIRIPGGIPSEDIKGYADCIGGVRNPGRAFAVGEDLVSFENQPLGPFTTFVNATAKCAAHEIGHLLGAEHHYANCAEGATAEELAAGELSPCTIMFNYIQFESQNFSTANGAVVRGYAVRCMDEEQPTLIESVSWGALKAKYR